MYELIQVGPRSYYINAPVKIGLSLLQDNQVCLIDSGNDKDAGEKFGSSWSNTGGSCK